jgi:predicted nucleotidyltransferase
MNIPATINASLPGVADALGELRRGLDALYGSRLYQVIVFGSVARGTATSDSDIDVLVVLHEKVNPGDEIRCTGRLVSDISLDHDCVIGCVFIGEEDFHNRQGPLLRNIRKEGIVV